MNDNRQGQDVSFQDVLVAVESQVIAIPSYGKKSLIEVKMFYSGPKVPVSIKVRKQMKVDSYDNCIIEG